MCRGSHLDLKVASKDNKWFRNAALKQDRIVIETRTSLNVAAMIGADMNEVFIADLFVFNCIHGDFVVCSVTRGIFDCWILSYSQIEFIIIFTINHPTVFVHYVNLKL